MVPLEFSRDRTYVIWHCASICGATGHIAAPELTLRIHDQLGQPSQRGEEKRVSRPAVTCHGPRENAQQGKHGPPFSGKTRPVASVKGMGGGRQSGIAASFPIVHNLRGNSASFPS